jgi:hypothetical protein
MDKHDYGASVAWGSLLCPSWAISWLRAWKTQSQVILKMEAIYSFETSVLLTKATWRHNPEDNIFHFYCREHIPEESGSRSYIVFLYEKLIKIYSTNQRPISNPTATDKSDCGLGRLKFPLPPRWRRYVSKTSVILTWATRRHIQKDIFQYHLSCAVVLGLRF